MEIYEIKPKYQQNPNPNPRWMNIIIIDCNSTSIYTFFSAEIGNFLTEETVFIFENWKLVLI